MTARKIYELETGNKAPDNQIAFREWFIDYAKWLETKVEKSGNQDKLFIEGETHNLQLVNKLQATIKVLDRIKKVITEYELTP